MALDPGNAIVGSGLAGALQTATEAAFGEFPTETARENTAKFNDMLATTIINYFKANAEIKIKTTDVGLQRDSDFGHLDTLGPNTDKTLTDVLF